MRQLRLFDFLTLIIEESKNVLETNIFIFPYSPRKNGVIINLKNRPSLKIFFYSRANSGKKVISFCDISKNGGTQSSCGGKKKSKGTIS